MQRMNVEKSSLNNGRLVLPPLTAQLCIRIYPLGILSVYSSQYSWAWRSTLFSRILPVCSPGRRLLFPQEGSGPCFWLERSILCLSVEQSTCRHVLRGTPVATSLLLSHLFLGCGKNRNAFLGAVDVNAALHLRPSDAALHCGEWSGLHRNPETSGNFHLASLQWIFEILSVPCQTL